MASGRLPIDDYADAYALENHQKDINNLEKSMVSKMRRQLFPSHDLQFAQTSKVDQANCAPRLKSNLEIRNGVPYDHYPHSVHSIEITSSVGLATIH